MVTLLANTRRRRSTLLCAVAGALAAAFLAPAAWPATASAENAGILFYEAAPRGGEQCHGRRSATGTVTITDLGAINPAAATVQRGSYRHTGPLPQPKAALFF